ncbi:unnamed protein product [Spodoptera littoralis]|uniref:Uncharacterized protein n=2 Tax=Spodoptera TaxID=7106 RepID=A0A9P0HYB7_SPOLI|nr:uncharacterized protein LOC111357494 [Spodoptera litura]CAB3507120.1 unnamed protein product [Spodoptera littoralis]CAH1636646.1 unnamed protein product [Spodoptera littoralis]
MLFNIFNLGSMRVWYLLSLLFGHCVCKVYFDKLDRYIISCHTTDFECFKRQYKALRDNVLLGNDRLGIPTYEHYVFAYGGGTCVKLTGLEESELAAIKFESEQKKLTLVLELPLRIQQVKDTIKMCARPDREFNIVQPQKSPLMRFTGNATIGITYPYKLKKKKGMVYLQLEDENLDVILDIPDLSHFHLNSEVEAKLYEWSEWAYEVVQHVDAAEYFALPYTSQLRTLMDHLPLYRFIMLYPEEEYEDLQFSYSEATVATNP